jgi:acetyl-CoA acetyltransferase
LGLRGETAIIGFGETPVSRARADKGEPRLTAEEYFAWAAELALARAGLEKKDFDGQGLGIGGTLWPHAEIWSAEMVQNLGLNPKLVLRADFGGMNGCALLTRAALAVHAGLVDYVLCVAGDAPMSIPDWGQVRTWRYELDFMLPYGMMGPNSMFAFVMRRHMHQYGTTVEHTGKIAVTQRQHASLNPNAYLRQPLTLPDYLSSRMIADPVRLLDCVIPVNGGLAYIVTSAERARKHTDQPVYLLGFGESDGYLHGSRNRPDVTYTGVHVSARRALEMAAAAPDRLSFFQPYDDYTIAVIMQLEDAGFCGKGAGGRFVEQTDLSVSGALPVNTGGGQLSAGQAGMAGGFLHLVEAVRQLRGEGGPRQVPDARTGLVTGIGGLAYGVNLVNTTAVVLGREV